MSIQRYAVAQGDEIINVIMADPAEYTPPEGQELILSESNGPEIGWTRVDGEWFAPVEPAPTLEQVKISANRDVTAKFQERVSSYPHDFGAPFGVQHLQLRGTDDQANWLTLQTTALNLITAGQGDNPVLAIRTEENNTVPVTANQAAQIMANLAAFGGQCKARQWALKDAVNAAEDAGAVAAVLAEIDEGWPL